jgi:riboflavin synthase|tara:strand:- start:113 stop:712 length:600 start_codon:yes stop_codon:yes gene_type:complete
VFSGIIEAKGKISDLSGHSISFIVDPPLTDLNESDSIMVDGACLTITNASNEGHRFTVDIVSETLKRTNLGQLSINDSVNLERSVKYGDRIGGHLVQGHVDSTGKILKITTVENSWIISVKIPKKIIKLCVEKGFIAINGTSLTLISVDYKMSSFEVAVVPYTYNNTTISCLHPGSVVNIETDVISKYVKNLIDPYNPV